MKRIYLGLSSQVILVLATVEISVNLQNLRTWTQIISECRTYGWTKFFTMARLAENSFKFDNG